MNYNDVLTVGFLEAHGVAVAKPLRDWLTRVSFIARTQTDAVKRERYEKWALYTVENAVNAPGGVAAVQWARQSTIMPIHADVQPAWWPIAPATAGSGFNGGASPPQLSSAVRTALVNETLRRAPRELEPFVHQGFALYDREVARGQRTYEQVTFVEMLNIAKSLFAKAPPSHKHQPQLPSAPPPQPATAFTQAVLSSPSLPPLTSPASEVFAPPVRNSVEYYPSREFPTTAISSSSWLQPPPTAQKRSTTAVAATEAYEPPAKKKYVAPLNTVERPTDHVFFMQLAGTFEVEKPPPPVFIGESNAMERAYTRYEPLVEDIRPLKTLKKALVYVTNHAKEVETVEGVRAGRKYLSDQLKGLRQDLRVQNIVKTFTVKVYEMHARLCLEMGDIGEFNQCQAALKQFYRSPHVNLSYTNVKEFFLYRVVYLTLSEQYDSLSTELINFTNAQMNDTSSPSVKVDKKELNRTLALCNACTNGDTPTICRLLMEFPTEMSYLVRIYLHKLRIMWLKEILTAMKGSLTIRFLMASLGFTPVADGDATKQQQEQQEKEKEPNAFWLDGSAEEANARLTDLFKTLKIGLPADFSFDAEVRRTKRAGPNPEAHFPSLDATTALKAVEEYLLYLGTRKDAGLR